jgi:arsenate reductase
MRARRGLVSRSAVRNAGRPKWPQRLPGDEAAGRPGSPPPVPSPAASSTPALVQATAEICLDISREFPKQLTAWAAATA